MWVRWPKATHVLHIFTYYLRLTYSIGLGDFQIFHTSSMWRILLDDKSIVIDIQRTLLLKWLTKYSRSKLHLKTYKAMQAHLHACIEHRGYLCSTISHQFCLLGFFFKLKLRLEIKRNEVTYVDLTFQVILLTSGRNINLKKSQFGNPVSRMNWIFWHTYDLELLLT